jgi:lipoprotein-releasing system permease protein
VLASFNMLGTLTLLVLEKQKDIQIIKALGAHEHWIFRVFLTESIFIGLIGGLIGWIAAFAFCFLQQTFHLIPLQGSFVIDYYPVKMMTTDVLLVILIILIIAILAGIYPSRKASQKQFSLKAQ